MEKTANYQLPQWVKEDAIKMEDFNAAFGTLDGALKANADAAAGAASAVSGSGAVRLIPRSSCFKACPSPFGQWSYCSGKGRRDMSGNGEEGTQEKIWRMLACHFAARMVK